MIEQLPPTVTGQADPKPPPGKLSSGSSVMPPEKAKTAKIKLTLGTVEGGKVISRANPDAPLNPNDPARPGDVVEVEADMARRLITEQHAELVA